MAGGRGLHGLFEGVAQAGDGFGEFVRLETELEGAAEFLFGDAERGRPLVGPAVELDRGVAKEIKLLGDPHQPAEERRPFLLGEDGEPAVQHAQRQGAREVLQAQRGRVGLKDIRHD